MKKRLIAAAAALGALTLAAPVAYAQHEGQGDDGNWRNHHGQQHSDQQGGQPGPQGGEHQDRGHWQGGGPGNNQVQGHGQGRPDIQRDERRESLQTQWQNGHGGEVWRGHGFNGGGPPQAPQVQTQWNNNNNGADHRWRDHRGGDGDHNWQNDNNAPPRVENYRRDGGGDDGPKPQAQTNWRGHDNDSRGGRGWDPHQWAGNGGYDDRRNDHRYDRYRDTHRDFDHPRYTDWRYVPRGGYFDDGYAHIVGDYYHRDYFWWSYGGWHRPYRRWAVGYVLPDYVYWEPLPYDLYYELPPAPYGCRYVMVDGDILLIAIETGIILDALMYY
jgi:hypothetical protein